MQEVLKKLQEHDKRFDQIDGQIDFLAKKVLEHDGQLGRIEEKMATKDDVGKMMNTLDRLVKITEKKDQELTFITHDMKRFDDRLEAAEKDIKKMKPALGLS